jgi:hypothetical protein
MALQMANMAMAATPSIVNQAVKQAMPVVTTAVTDALAAKGVFDVARQGLSKMKNSTSSKGKENMAAGGQLQQMAMVKPSYDRKKPKTNKTKNGMIQKQSSVTMQRVSELGGVLTEQSRTYQRLEFSGSETIGPIVAHQNVTDYLYFALKPDLLPVLNYESKLWQQFRFKSLKVTYIGMQGQDTVGQIALVPQYKAPMAALNVPGFQSVVSADGSSWGPVRESEGRICAQYDMRRLRQDRQWYDTTQLGTLNFGPWNYSGGLLIVYDSVYLNGHTGDLMIGNLQFDYVVEFQHRDTFFAPTEFLKNSDFVDPNVAGQIKEAAGHPVGGGSAINYDTMLPSQLKAERQQYAMFKQFLNYMSTQNNQNDMQPAQPGPSVTRQTQPVDQPGYPVVDPNNPGVPVYVRPRRDWSSVNVGGEPAVVQRRPAGADTFVQTGPDGSQRIEIRTPWLGAPDTKSVSVGGYTQDLSTIVQTEDDDVVDHQPVVANRS